MAENRTDLEVLRGEPIQVFTGNSMDIPCIETSDPERLCRHPVVSVHMITYNHESYIRQAIEGVMMQKTDFEFELVIGEDCSTDKTREICFEYQKRYPDKIRVLWWHKNSYQFPHPAGGNSARNTAHCRGEFIAWCEGDDYWIDPFKLQKQVDVMRKYPNVGLCFCGSRYYNEVENSWRDWNKKDVFPHGLMSGEAFFFRHMFGHDFVSGNSDAYAIMTATVLLRKAVLEVAYEKFDIFKWKLWLGDTTHWLGISALADVYYCPDVVSVYRLTGSGACSRGRYRLWRDGAIVRAYYLLSAKNQMLRVSPYWFKHTFFMWMMDGDILTADKQKRSYIRHCLGNKTARSFLLSLRELPIILSFLISPSSKLLNRLCDIYYRHIAAKLPERSPLLNFYRKSIEP